MGVISASNEQRECVFVEVRCDYAIWPVPIAGRLARCSNVAEPKCVCACMARDYAHGATPRISSHGENPACYCARGVARMMRYGMNMRDRQHRIERRRSAP